MGRTARDGTLLLPRLLPYEANRLSLEDQDIPYDRAISVLHQTVAPPSRGGVLVQFDADVTRYARGHVVLMRGGEPVVPAYGELEIRMDGIPVTSPLGGGGEFELEGVLPGEHAAWIFWKGDRCKTVLTVPDSEERLLELGEVRCPPEGADPPVDGGEGGVRTGLPTRPTPLEEIAPVAGEEKGPAEDAAPAKAAASNEDESPADPEPGGANAEDEE